MIHNAVYLDEEKRVIKRERESKREVKRRWEHDEERNLSDYAIPYPWQRDVGAIYKCQHLSSIGEKLSNCLSSIILIVIAF